MKRLLLAFVLVLAMANTASAGSFSAKIDQPIFQTQFRSGGGYVTHCSGPLMIGEQQVGTATVRYVVCWDPEDGSPEPEIQKYVVMEVQLDDPALSVVVLSEIHAGAGSVTAEVFDKETGEMYFNGILDCSWGGDDFSFTFTWEG